MNLNINLDPKLSTFATRLAKVKRIIAVSGFKGGVGKSSVSCVLALLLAEKGFKTGLLDLDFNGASCDVILGRQQEFPEEIEGLDPPLIEGVKFMTPAYFTQNKAVNLRGGEITNALLELVAVTRWQELDYLILDMPPGFADTALDVIRFMHRAEVLIIKTPSVLSTNLVAKAEAALKGLNVEIIGEIENMSPAALRQDSALEAAYGKPKELLKTQFAADLNNEVKRIFNI